MNWKQQALNLQLSYKASLGLTKSGSFRSKPYPQILSNTDAQIGANFYTYPNEKAFNELKDWVNKANGKAVNFCGIGLKNMLRSEHIPYNLFHPIAKENDSNPKLVLDFFQELFGVQVDIISQIRIEYSSHIPRSELLNDNTSFDAYIEAQFKGKTIGFGIEVKYTEKSYPYGRTEKEQMFEMPGSEYNQLTSKSGYYLGESLEKLKTTKLKQFWRNHLLGIRLVELQELDEFYSVHLYPEGNTYQHQAAQEYQECLEPEHQFRFKPVTFERFIEIAASHFLDKESEKWLEYLRDRY
jgi:hypothetical protein